MKNYEIWTWDELCGYEFSKSMPSCTSLLVKNLQLRLFLIPAKPSRTKLSLKRSNLGEYSFVEKNFSRERFRLVFVIFGKSSQVQGRDKFRKLLSPFHDSFPVDLTRKSL